MLDSFIVSVTVSSVLGFLAGIGVGGGSLLILWLTLVLQLEYPQARIINLLFFLPSAIVASLFRWRQGNLDLKRILPAILTGCIAAGICAWLSTKFDTALLKKFFGALLLATGIRELFYKPKNTRPGQN